MQICVALTAALIGCTPIAEYQATPGAHVESAVEGAWLTVKGAVTSVADDRFTVDYGRDDIVVEMDDFDRFESPIAAGDVVTVSGRMDDDFFEGRTIKASLVYVDSRNESFHASAADEAEWLQLQRFYDDISDDEWLSLTGEVSRIDGENMTLDTGVHEYAVDTSRLAYDPFDGEGPVRIEIGQRVIVFGQMDDADLFDNREIEARSITKLPDGV